jgi:hypothetical protein
MVFLERPLNFADEVSMRQPEDLEQCIQRVIKDYHKIFVIDELYETDEIRIRRRGPGVGDHTAEDVVGVYSDEGFAEGKVNEDSIRNDVQRWLQKNRKTV